MAKAMAGRTLVWLLIGGVLLVLVLGFFLKNSSGAFSSFLSVVGLESNNDIALEIKEASEYSWNEIGSDPYSVDRGPNYEMQLSVKNTKDLKYCELQRKDFEGEWNIPVEEIEQLKATPCTYKCRTVTNGPFSFGAAEPDKIEFMVVCVNYDDPAKIIRVEEFVFEFESS